MTKDYPCGRTNAKPWRRAPAQAERPSHWADKADGDGIWAATFYAQGDLCWDIRLPSGTHPCPGAPEAGRAVA